MKKAPHKNGFTLIELILVTAILAVIGLAVYSTFVNGINIWKTITQQTIAEDLDLFFERISFDLRNSFKLTGIRFRGERSRVTFPVRFKDHNEDGIQNSIGQVTYAYNRRKRTLVKRIASYSEVYRKKPGIERELAAGASSLAFEYYVYEPEKKTYTWVTNWQRQESDETFGVVVEENLPLIVKIEVGIPTDQGEKKYVKNVLVPSACCWPFEAEWE